MQPNLREGDRPALDLQSIRLPAFAPHSAPDPFVVAIEGPNGAGKTTLSWALSRQLGAPWWLGTDEAWFAEPFKVRMIRDAEWHASALFFLSGCFEQDRLLRNRSNRLVIMDRCLWSTLAVHAAENQERLKALITILEPIAHLVHIPHLTIVLEASFPTCQSRIAKKSGTARALDELTATAAFHQREREFYRWLAIQSHTVTFLDADRANEEEVAEKAMTIIRPKLDSRTGATGSRNPRTK
jgi:thymidylate kinase